MKTGAQKIQWIKTILSGKVFVKDAMLKIVPDTRAIMILYMPGADAYRLQKMIDFVTKRRSIKAPRCGNNIIPPLSRDIEEDSLSLDHSHNI